MTTASNLQCPHCNCPIDLPQAIVIESGAKTLCEHCQQTITADNKTISTDSIINTELLIHDDMEIDDPVDSINEYDSLEGMNAWVARSNVSLSTPFGDLVDNNVSSNYSVDNRLTDIETSVDLRDDNHNIAISSAEANNIHATIANHTSADTHENAWLETLLQEQNIVADSVANDYKGTELEHQLIEMKAPTVNTSANNQTHTHTTQSRSLSSVVTTSVTPSQHDAPAISNLLWLIGSGLLILLLFMQYVIFNINTLAKNTAVASRLQDVCSVIHCTIPSADINAFAVTNPTVQASQVKDVRSFSDIQAQLVNESAKTQLLPTLKISIYNKDTIIGEFIAEPSHYLMSNETKLAAERRKSVMFTVPIIAKKVSKVVVEPFY